MKSSNLNISKEIIGLSKDLFIYGFGGSIGALVGIFTAPIMTRIFIPAEYGIIGLINTTIGFILMLGGLNVVSGVYRYYYEDKSIEDQTKLLSTGLILFFAILILLGKPIHRG